MMPFSSAGSVRDVSANPLKSLRAGCLREVREVTRKSLKSLRGVCGREVPIYAVYKMVPLEGGTILLLSKAGAA